MYRFPTKYIVPVLVIQALFQREEKVLDDPALPSEWQRCYAAFLLHYSAASVHTRNAYRSILRQFFTCCPSPPGLVTREDIDRFLSAPLVRGPRRGLAPSARTRNLRLHVVGSFYRFASSFLLDGAPLFPGPSPALGFKRQRVRLTFRGMTYDELVRFFAVIPTDTVRGLRDRALFLCYFWTARRRSEIARLKWGDLEYGTITDAEGRSYQGWLYHFVGKGRARFRDVAELPAPAKESIDAYLVAAGRLDSIAPDDPLFQALPPPHGGGLPLDPQRPLTGQTVWLLLKSYCAAAGLDTRRVTVHSFRHTAAQQRHLHGENLRSLQHLLRHASISTTNAYLEAATSAADPGSHKLMEDSRFRFSVGGE